MTRLEARLRDALYAEALQVEESPDLFARVKGSIEDEGGRRRWRRRVAAITGTALAAFAVLIAAVTDFREGEFLMDWRILELVTTAILVVIVIVLGPFIKRFGKSYAAEVFRANPATGKSFIVLMDFAYYLVFGAYVLFTPVFNPPDTWSDMANAAQLKVETMKIAGILLLMGVLHGVNLLMLPIIGRLLMLNKQLDQEMRDREGGPQRPQDPGAAGPTGAP
ncbi:MAG TPA: hypothetical protein VMM78_01000 [Thermomicrobiales bacterium]|nr:hypothetical protein [Thermomicrobiales bacterium]